MLVLSNDDVGRVLTMQECIAALEVELLHDAVFDQHRVAPRADSHVGHGAVDLEAEFLRSFAVAVTQHADLALRLLDIQNAIDSPHMGSRNGPTELEQGTQLERLVPELERMGHAVRIRPETSGLHGIVRTPRGWAGGADPRREGAALGD